MAQNTVQLGYIHNADGSLTRTLIDSRGRVYVAGQWAHHDGRVSAEAPARRFERWTDVPAAWVGTSPFWA